MANDSPPYLGGLTVTATLKLADGREVVMTAEAPRGAFATQLTFAVEGDVMLAIPFTLVGRDGELFVKWEPDDPLRWMTPR